MIKANQTTIITLIVCFGFLLSFSNGFAEAAVYPEHIVVFPQYAEEILLEMVGPDRIVYVGHEYFDDGESYSPTMPLTKNIPGRIWSMSSDEFILSLQPDLVVLDSSFQDDKDGPFPFLRKENVPVLYTEHPEDLEGICEVIKMLGDAVGEPERAEEMTTRLRYEMSEIHEIASGLNRSAYDKVFYYSNWQTDFTWFAEYVGMNDVCERSWLEGIGPQEYYYDDELDEIAQKSEPAIIFYYPHYIDTDGSILQIDGYKNHLPDDLIGDPALAHVPAIVNRKIYPLTLYRSQYVVQTLIDMLCYEHPEVMEMIESSEAFSRYSVPRTDNHQ